MKLKEFIRMCLLTCLALLPVAIGIALAANFSEYMLIADAAQNASGLLFLFAMFFFVAWVTARVRSKG